MFFAIACNARKPILGQFLSFGRLQVHYARKSAAL
jgi:hypothetical protein